METRSQDIYVTGGMEFLEWDPDCYLDEGKVGGGHNETEPEGPEIAIEPRCQ